MFKILIVDDYQITQDVLKDWLAKELPLMEIETASSGKEAMEKIHKVPPDLVFMDIRLPDISGLKLTKEIKTRFPSIDIVILTSYDTTAYQNVAKEYGATRFFCKGLICRSDLIDLTKSLAKSKEEP